MSITNILLLTGRLTRDPEIKRTTSGKSLAKFSLAVSEYKDKVMFVNCTAWDKMSDIIGNHYKKGMLVLVKGSLVIDKKDDKQYVSCNVHEAQIMDWGKNNKESQTEYSSGENYNVPKQINSSGSEVDEFDAADMPF